MIAYRCWLGVLLLGMASLLDAAPAEEDASAWIERMTQAVRTLSYEGTFVYVHGGKLETMQVAHAVHEGEERERLVSLNGMAKEVIRDAESVICILPHAKVVSVSGQSGDRGFPVVLPNKLTHLVEYYDFHLRGDTRIAGRPAKVVVIVPKDAYRYGYRLFLDAEHALPLQTDMLNGLGMAVAQTMFTEMRVDPSIRVESPLPSLEQDGYTRIDTEAPASETGPTNWRFKYFPAGFELTTRAQFSHTPGFADAEHFVLSDGLATLSVYVEKLGEEAGLQGTSRMGAINVFGTQMGGYQITVVGEVPARTVEYVAHAIEPITAGYASD